jgi:RimJ/RimL family protein N-acetyltransferase
MLEPVQIQTPRLLLREFEAGDFAGVHRYASDLEVVRHMEWGPNTEEETRNFLRLVMETRAITPRHDFTLAVCLGEGVGGRSGEWRSGEVIGGCTLHITDAGYREAYIGYCLARNQWGRGYATEVARGLLKFGFEDLELHRIHATCDPRNDPSARVLEKIGMQREGRLREHVLQRGEWRDSWLYAILEREYRGR